MMVEVVKVSQEVDVATRALKHQLVLRLPNGTEALVETSEQVIKDLIGNLPENPYPRPSPTPAEEPPQVGEPEELLPAEKVGAGHFPQGRSRMVGVDEAGNPILSPVPSLVADDDDEEEEEDLVQQI